MKLNYYVLIIYLARFGPIWCWWKRIKHIQDTIKGSILKFTYGGTKFTVTWFDLMFDLDTPGAWIWKIFKRHFQNFKKLDQIFELKISKRFQRKTQKRNLKNIKIIKLLLWDQYRLRSYPNHRLSVSQKFY